MVSPPSSVRAGFGICFKEKIVVDLTLYEFWGLGFKKPYSFRLLPVGTLRPSGSEEAQFNLLGVEGDMEENRSPS